MNHSGTPLNATVNLGVKITVRQNSYHSSHPICGNSFFGRIIKSNCTVSRLIIRSLTSKIR